MVCGFRQIVISFSFLVLLVSCKNEQKTFKSDIPACLKDGDVAFRRGNGLSSYAVLAMDGSGTYSHVGVIISKDSSFYVVHEVPYEGETIKDDGIKCESVYDFFLPEKAGQGAIYRVEMSDEERAKIKAFLIRQVDLGTPFDHDYDLSDDSAQYCTELVWRAFLCADIDLPEGRLTKTNLPGFSGYYLLPSDIEVNNRLGNIYRF